MKLFKVLNILENLGMTAIRIDMEKQSVVAINSDKTLYSETFDSLNNQLVSMMFGLDSNQALRGA